MRWFQLDPSYWLYHAADWCRDELAGTRTGAVGIEVFELAAELWYWLIVGALLSALASHYLPRTRLEDLLSQHRAGSVIGASLLGRSGNEIPRRRGPGRRLRPPRAGMLSRRHDRRGTRLGILVSLRRFPRASDPALRTIVLPTLLSSCNLSVPDDSWSLDGI